MRMCVHKVDFFRNTFRQIFSLNAFSNYFQCTKMPEENAPENRGFAALKDHVMNNRLDTALWASRILTVVFAIGYIIPIFG